MKKTDSINDKDKIDSEIYKKTGIMPIEDEALANVAGGMVLDTEVYWPDLWTDAYYDLIGVRKLRAYKGGSMRGDERFEEVLNKLEEWRSDMGRTGDVHSVPDWLREFWDPNTSAHYKGG